MKTKEKKKAHYGLLVLLFLLLGLGIQVGLGYQRLSRGEAQSARLLEQLSLSARTDAECSVKLCKIITVHSIIHHVRTRARLIICYSIIIISERCYLAL